MKSILRKSSKSANVGQMCQRVLFRGELSLDSVYVVIEHPKKSNIQAVHKLFWHVVHLIRETTFVLDLWNGKGRGSGRVCNRGVL